ncbi:MAG: ABC transporter permease [Actinomycetota bacterium]
MNALGLTVRQFSFENKSFWRNPAAAFFTFLFPLLFLVIFTTIFEDVTRLPTGGRVNSATYYTAAILAFGVISATFTNIAISVTFLREEGVLKRVRGTPMPGSSYLLGKVVHAVFVQALLVAITLAFGVIFYDVSLPTSTALPFAVMLIVGAAAFCMLGLATTSVVPNVDAAPPIVNAIVLPLLFISGVFVPTTNAPEWLTSLAGFFPIKHFVEGVFVSYLGLNDSGWRAGDLGIIALWGAAGLILAARYFRWEPRR